MYTVYVLKSLKDGRTYVGCSKDVENRVKEHNAGEVKSTIGRFHLFFGIKKNLQTSMKHLNVNNTLRPPRVVDN